ncbi:unnamed protein product, partial [Protopolystoma xenopodis]
MGGGASKSEQNLRTAELITVPNEVAVVTEDVNCRQVNFHNREKYDKSTSEAVSSLDAASSLLNERYLAPESFKNSRSLPDLSVDLRSSERSRSLHLHTSTTARLSNTLEKCRAPLPTQCLPEVRADAFLTRGRDGSLHLVNRQTIRQPKYPHDPSFGELRVDADADANVDADVNDGDDGTRPTGKVDLDADTNDDDSDGDANADIDANVNADDGDAYANGNADV